MAKTKSKTARGAKAGKSSRTARPGWKLVWNDEFDGDQLDPAKWDIDIGNGFFDYKNHAWIPGWGNEELQYYTGEPDNLSVRNGRLTIRAVKESLHGCGYTSARLKTRQRDGSPLFNKRSAASSSAPRCRGARACGRHSGCCRRMTDTVAGQHPARST